MLHVQEEHSGGVGAVGAVDACEEVVDVVLGEHDFCDLGVVLGLILPHPQDFGSGETGKGDVGRQLGQLLLANLVVEVVHLLGGAAVVPQNGGANHIVVFVQDHQAVHLAARSDARHLAGVEAAQQLRDALQHGLFPVLGILLAPAGLGELQGVVFGYNVFNLALPVHQQQLDSGGAQVDSDIQHGLLLTWSRTCGW